jgi:DNA-binding NarL/FixJ family response regulator
VVLEGLRRFLDRPEFEIVGTVQDGRTLIEAAGKLKPDVMVVYGPQVTFPRSHGVRGLLMYLKGKALIF